MPSSRTGAAQEASPLRGSRAPPPKIIFDSSFLMAVSERPTTWFEDITEGIGIFEPLMLDCVSKELERLASYRNARSRAARVALELGSLFKRAPCGPAPVDDEIASAALALKARVATTDSKMTKNLRSLHIGVIALKAGRVSTA